MANPQIIHAHCSSLQLMLTIIPHTVLGVMILEEIMFLNLPMVGSISSGFITRGSSVNEILLDPELERRCSVLSPAVAITTLLLWVVLNSVKSSSSFSFSMPGVERGASQIIIPTL